MTARRWLIALGAVAAVAVIATWPVTTRWGLNYHVARKRIPLYEKAINFISRDLQLRRLTRELIAGTPGEEQQLLRLFSWVTEHIRPTPDGFPIMDDHVLHVIIRGYGAADQRTEVFAVLASYVGFQASVAQLTPPSSPRRNLLVALVTSGARTYVFDIINQVVFRDAGGHLADAHQLLADPRLIEAAAPGRVLRGMPYRDYFLGFDRSKIFSRTEAQQLWPRLKQEVERVLGGRHG